MSIIYGIFLKNYVKKIYHLICIILQQFQGVLFTIIYNIKAKVSRKPDSVLNSHLSRIYIAIYFKPPTTKDDGPS